MFVLFLLTTKEKIVTRNAQDAKNHCILHTAMFGFISAKRIMVEAGIRILVINKSAKAIFPINAFPVKHKVLSIQFV